MLTMKDWFGWGYEHYVTPELRSRTPADVVNDLAFPWLERHASDDFFLFLHYWDPHVPYVPPEPYRTRLTAGVPRQDPAEVGRTLRASPSYPLFKRLNYDRIGEIPSVDYISALYDAEIAFLDDQLGRLFDHLVALGIYDDTLIVLFGDHGENLFEHDAWWDHAGLYECVVNVPLMVRHPATVRPGTVVDATVQLVDVFPTVCEAARIDVPEATDGISVWPLIRGQRTRQYDVVCLSECTWQAKRAIRTGRWKYIRCYDAGVYGRWEPELYNLEADPTERQNLAHDLTGVAADLDDSLSEWLEAQLGGAPDPMEAVLDGELPGARRLRDAIREEARRPLRERMAPAGL
jgi:arylsulfatase A-like enzyme